MKTLDEFIGKQQLELLNDGMRGEEKEAFQGIYNNLLTTINAMPKTYETEGQGTEAVAHLHYFMGNMDWYITEVDIEDEQLQAFGLANLGYGGELGYINIKELAANNIELDFYWTPTKLKDIK